MKINSKRWLDIKPFKNEIWKDINSYEGKYQVSNYGRIKSLIFKNGNIEYSREKILTIKTTGAYPHILLYKNGKGYNYTIHYLVAQAFIPNPEGYLEVNHIDENTYNNKVNNLEWCSHKYNINYGNRTEKAKEKLSIKIEQYDLKDSFIKTWNSIHDAMRVYNNSHIVDVCKGKRKTASGYKWFYKED